MEEEKDDLEKSVEKRFGNWTELEKHILSMGARLPIIGDDGPELFIPFPKDHRLLNTDELARKASTLTSGIDTFIPRIWGPAVEKNLHVGNHPWSELRNTLPPKKTRRRIPLRSRIAWFLHDLSEKFEECGYRDY